MIKYRLACSAGHEFEGWFQSSDAYDVQAAKGHVTCPHCGSPHVAKAIMAPSVSMTAKHAGSEQVWPGANKLSSQELQVLMRRLRREIEAKADYVGPRFAEEARKMHEEEESSDRGIYGEATLDEATSLAEDGIAFLPIPRLPEDLN
jgi:hypothetical protein